MTLCVLPVAAIRQSQGGARAGAGSDQEVGVRLPSSRNHPALADRHVWWHLGGSLPRHCASRYEHCLHSTKVSSVGLVSDSKLRWVICSVSPSAWSNYDLLRAARARTLSVVRQRLGIPAVRATKPSHAFLAGSELWRHHARPLTRCSGPATASMSTQAGYPRSSYPIQTQRRFVAIVLLIHTTDLRMQVLRTEDQRCG